MESSCFTQPTIPEIVLRRFVSGKGGQGRCGDVRGEGCEGGEEVEGRESGI